MNLKAKQRFDFIIGNFLLWLNLIVTRILGFLLHRNHDTRQQQPSNILVIKILGFGSLVMAAHSIYSLKVKYPNARLILMCGPGVKEGAELLKLFDDIWVIDDHSMISLARSSFSALWKCWKMKKLWVMDLEVYSKLTTIFALWTCAINRFGFIMKSVGFRFRLNTHNIYFNQFSIVEKNYQRVVTAMGCTEILSFQLSSDEKRNRDNLTTIAINNTCSDLSLERKMPDEQLAKVIQWLLTNTAYQLVLLGAPSDKPRNEQLIKKYFTETSSDRLKNFAGEISFGEYFKMLYLKCRIMLTIDSGPLHIARLLGVPTLSLWGPTDPKAYIETGPIHRAIYLGVACSPCVHQVTELPCHGNNFCIKNISLEQIGTEFRELEKANHEAGN
ncbi:MAG: glycosyltransferase family 9 protein [Cytophagaceae bacterium]|nr:glycosyltransferase family 9 protein [Cytophagaceae bacterium]